MGTDEKRHKEKVIIYIVIAVILVLFISAYVYVEFAHIPEVAPASAPVAATPDHAAETAATMARLEASSTPASQAEISSVIAAMHAKQPHR